MQQEVNVEHRRILELSKLLCAMQMSADFSV